MAHDVFISHSSKDKTTADAVCAVLESKSIRCWVAPRDIQPGADWGEAILEGIRGSRVMVLVFSRNANESVQIKREVERAVHHAIPIIPLRIEDILPTGTLEFSISTAHWLDAFTPPMERHLTYLATTVGAILDGKPGPKPLPPPPPSRPSWINAAIGVGAVGGALLIYLVLHLLFPPSIKGNWNLSQCTLTVGQNSAIGDLMTAALTGSNIKGQLQVKSLNEYTASISATDSGTVTSSGNVNAPGGISSSALTFTSNSTHKPVVITYYFEQNNTDQWGMYGALAGEKVVLFGVNAGGGEVLVHGNPSGDSGTPGPVDGALVGTWAGTPFNLNPPNNLWSGTLAIHADGTYLITVTHDEGGILNTSGGNWSATPSAAANGMPSLTIFSSPFAPGHFSFSGSNTLNVAASNGTFTYTRGW
jgi:TIR domain